MFITLDLRCDKFVECDAISKNVRTVSRKNLRRLTGAESGSLVRAREGDQTVGELRTFRTESSQRRLSSTDADLKHIEDAMIEFVFCLTILIVHTAIGMELVSFLLAHFRKYATLLIVGICAFLGFIYDGNCLSSFLGLYMLVVPPMRLCVLLTESLPTKRKVVYGILLAIASFPIAVVFISFVT